jgi:hypothetical protein
MVRHTHRRRQTKGRRRNTRRSRRTQRGGFSFSSFFGSSDDVTVLEKKLAQETDPEKKAKIQKDIKIAEEDKRHEEAIKKIEEAPVGATESAVSSQSPSNSSVSNDMVKASTGAGQMPSNGANMYSVIGGRRRSRRYRRR